ncbi:MAG: alpha/beta hydrolase [Chloroflexi bacterium]|nr:alpha/beta hydrolase [Chloroflexota bacterium]
MQAGFVQAGRVRLRYFEHGQGQELVVLVHGYQSSGRIWRLAQEALDPARFRSIAFSNRGAGESDRTPHEQDYTVESFAQDLHSAVLALGLRDFTLVGHSMGGATVTQYALDHPERLKALVLLDPASLAGRSLPEGWEEKLREDFSAGRLTATGSAQGSDHANPEVPAAFRQALADDVARNPLERLLGGRRSMASLRLRPRLTELRMPTLVVGGDQDATVGVDNILAEYLALPSETRALHIFHGHGHSPNVEAASAFAAVLGHFVVETVPGAIAASRT